MKFKIILIFIIQIRKIYLMIDYCNTRIFPNEPNDCVFFSTDKIKCCFNPNNTTRCFEENKNKSELICKEDYFYNFMTGSDKYNKYKDKRGYCTFIYKDIKGAFVYDEVYKKVLKINEVKDLEVKCLNNRNIKINIYVLIFIVFLIFL